MFSYIKGELAELNIGCATVEACGVGYSLTISQTTHGKLTRLQQGDTAKLYTYLSVREDGVELFGFYDTEELNFFKLLIISLDIEKYFNVRAILCAGFFRW